MQKLHSKDPFPRSRSALEFRESLLDHKFGSALEVSQFGELAQDPLRAF